MKEDEYDFFWCSSCASFKPKSKETIQRAALGKGQDKKSTKVKIKYIVKTIFLCTDCVKGEWTRREADNGKAD